MNKFYNEITKYKLLSKDEEYNLFEKQNKGDTEAFNQLVTSNQLNIIMLVRKFHLPNNITLDDLIQEANIALIKSINKFDYKTKNRFISYATKVINNHIIKFININSRVIKLTEILIPKFNKISKLNLEYDKDFHQACDEAGISKYYQNKYIQYNNTIKQLDDTCLNIEDVFYDDEDDKLQKAINQLSLDEQYVINRIFGLNDIKKIKQKELAEELNFSHNKMFNVKSAILKKLKKRINENR